jgi:hypothetical protein
MPRSSTPPLLALLLPPVLLGCFPHCGGERVETTRPQTVEARKPGPAAGIAGLNGFVENRGQWPDDVLFFARRGGVEATVRRDALAFRPVPPSADAPAPVPLVLHLPGDATCRVVEGLERLATQHHFLTGDRPASGAAGFERVALRGVLPGVDVVLRADGGAFEYDLVLAPGASLADFVVEVEGASRLELREASALVLQTEAGEVEQRIRASWQGEAGEAVACTFRALEPRNARQRFGFEAPTWDRDLALVLDPSLVYLTYVGGAGQELLIEAEMDAAGAMHLLARTAGGTPVTSGALQGAVDGLSPDAWIGKLAPDGSTLEWATFLGGSETDEPKDLALLDDGSVIVVGSTWSPGFPVTPGCFQEQIGGGGTTKADVFVARLHPTGSSLAWATFYGAENHDTAWACAAYQGGDVLVAFEPYVAGLASTPGALDETYDASDQALVRLSADGTQRLWQTYFRASTIDDLLIDEESNAYLVGHIFDSDAPLMTTPGAYKVSMAPGDTDGYVTKLHPDGAHLVWSTYLGGEPGVSSSGSDRVYAVDLDAAGAVYVAGSTESETFPTTPGAFQPGVPGGSEGFAAKLLPNGTDLVWATYIGATGFPGSTSIRDIKVDQAGNALVFGQANEPDFPVTPDALQPVFVGGLFANSDSLLCKLDASGESLVYATWLGGNGSDTQTELALDEDGHAHLAFQTFSSDLPASDGDPYAGSGDLVIAELDFELLPWSILPGGLAGADVPTLVGIGPLTAGSTARLSLCGAPPNDPAWVVAGLLQIGLPFLGGTLVPFPTVVVPLASDSMGEIDFAFPWPTAPAGTTVFFQVWAPDPLAPQGWSASHGLQAMSQ